MRRKAIRPQFVIALSLLATGWCVGAGPALSAPRDYDPPPGYYDTVDPTSPETLSDSLYEIIRNHQRYSYSETWGLLEVIDQDPGSPGDVITVYKNASRDGPSHFPAWNREHTWPSTYGFPSNSDIPYTDCHQLRASDEAYNGARGSLPFDFVSSGSEWVTEFNNGVGGGSGTYPGNSNWTGGGAWEVWNHRQGDVARGILYLDVRYEGDVHSPTGTQEPDLQLTNSAGSISPGQPYMGLLDTILEWHLADPVDEEERRRNHMVFGYQANRNPFVDHPEWVCQIWGDEVPCQGAPTPEPTFTPTRTPTGFPSDTPTRTPTGSQIPTRTPTWTPTGLATGTGTPSPEPTLEPSPTADPGAIWYRLEMADRFLTPGDSFRLGRTCGNPTGEQASLDEYVVLDVSGQYWFYPSWTPQVDHGRFLILPGQESGLEILAFQWPDGAGAGQEILFWAALTWRDTVDLVALDWVEWGFGG